MLPLKAQVAKNPKWGHWTWASVLLVYLLASTRLASHWSLASGEDLLACLKKREGEVSPEFEIDISQTELKYDEVLTLRE